MAARKRAGGDLERQTIALAKQLGHLAGTLERTASQMMARLGRGQPGKTVRPSRPSASGARAGSPAHAPGKRRRKPAPTVRGAKKSDLAIPKLRTAKVVRQRRKTHF